MILSNGKLVKAAEEYKEQCLWSRTGFAFIETLKDMERSHFVSFEGSR